MGGGGVKVEEGPIKEEDPQTEVADQDQPVEDKAEGVDGPSLLYLKVRKSDYMKEEDRQIELRELVEKCTEERLRRLVADVIDREPGLLFDLLVDDEPDEPVPGPTQQLPWCKCGNCREMATKRERLCCGCRPEHCMSRREEVERLVLDPQMLMVHQNYRDELLGCRGQQIEDYNRTMRHAAYRTRVLVRLPPDAIPHRSTVIHPLVLLDVLA